MFCSRLCYDRVGRINLWLCCGGIEICLLCGQIILNGDPWLVSMTTSETQLQVKSREQFPIKIDVQDPSSDCSKEALAVRQNFAWPGARRVAQGMWTMRCSTGLLEVPTLPYTPNKAQWVQGIQGPSRASSRAIEVLRVFQLNSHMFPRPEG